MIVLTSIFFMANPLIIDFGQNKNANWFSVNDTVMGGRSEGNVDYSENSLVFKGSVSFENNGGFASARSSFGSYDLSEYETVTVRYKSDGQSLSLNFDYYRAWWYPNYKATLPATDGEWQSVTIALADLKEYRVGRATGNKISKSQLEQIIRLGLMTNDKKEGPFQAEIDFVKFN